MATTSNDEILAGIGDFGYKEGGMIFRSMDNGGTWTDISTTLSSSNSVVGIVVNNNGVIFAAMSTTSAEGDGIFRSTDGGSTWGQVNNGLAQTKMSALAINAKGDLFASASGILYRSINSGDTWSPLSSENSAITGVSTIAIATNGDIYTESANGIYRSSNNGDSWESIATGFANSQARRIYVTPNGGVFVGTSGKVYRLNDSGTAWTVLEYDINKPIYKAPMAITSDATGVVYVGLDGGGVYRSISAGN